MLFLTNISYISVVRTLSYRSSRQKKFRIFVTLLEKTALFIDYILILFSNSIFKFFLWFYFYFFNSMNENYSKIGCGQQLTRIFATVYLYSVYIMNRSQNITSEYTNIICIKRHIYHNKQYIKVVICAASNKLYIS